MVLKYTKERNLKSLFLILLDLMILIKIYVIYGLCKYKYNIGLIKFKNHTVSCWEKCVSFKGIYVLRNGLTLIIICLIR